MQKIELTDEQHLYLQRILDYFRENGQWPTYWYLDKSFARSSLDLDIEEIWKSLPPGLTSHMDLNQSGSKATLTIPAIYTLEHTAHELGTFLQTLRLCVDIYMRSIDEAPKISSYEIIKHNPLWWDKGVHRTGLLFLTEPDIWSKFSGPDEAGNWKCTLARQVRRFRNITSIEEYLEKRDLPTKIASTPAMPNSIATGTSITAQYVQLHPDIQTKCWRSYANEDYDTAILNATKAIEVAIRKKSGQKDDVLGKGLVTTAFSLKKPLLRYSHIEAEQEGLMSLLCGIIQVYKNPQSHRFVGVQNKSECLGVLLMCSNLLYVIDNTTFVA